MKNRKALASLFLSLLFAMGTPLLSEGEEGREPLKRRLLALYDGITAEDTSKSEVYTYAEKPLNHLGFIVKYCDIHRGLPDLDDTEGIFGVITWFKSEHVGIDPKIALEWCKKAVKKGLKFFVIGEALFQLESENELSLEEKNSFWNLLGIEEGEWISAPYLTRVVDLNPTTMNFERDSTIIEQPYRIMKAISSRAIPHATARHRNSRSLDSHLVITAPKGGYMNGLYALFSFLSDLTGITYYWRVNPFALFEIIFDADSHPKVDVTTEMGRRIYYSHIDGDGWNNGPQLAMYKENTSKISAETVYRKVIAPFPDLPVSCGPIGADLADDWEGSKESRRIAKMLFSLPQVEIACHTMSHPFYWAFYEDYLPQDEIKYLSHYPHNGWEGNQQYEDTYKKAVQNMRKKVLKESYDMPRGFADKPFDLDLEVQGAIDLINSLAPKGKKVEIYLWSGDCVPFEEAVEKTIEAGVKNLNGGDARFDYVYSSYVWLPPIARWVGDKLQVHACSSNENTYTKLWQGKYWAFSNLPVTYINSEYPIRLLPINFYYHIYCSEKDPGLSSLLNNIKFIRNQKICPLFASSYAEIVEGFFSATITPLSKSSWEIAERKGANTIRFDRASLLSVDFESSRGVIGERHYQGSLYVALDRAVERAVISLKENLSIEREPVEALPYLIESRWRIYRLHADKAGSIAFKARGFGAGEMEWSTPKNGEYTAEIEVDGKLFSKTFRAVDNILKVEIDPADNREVSVAIRPL